MSTSSYRFKEKKADYRNAKAEHFRGLDKTSRVCLTPPSSPAFEDNRSRRQSNAMDRADFIKGTIKKYKDSKSLSRDQRQALKLAHKAMDGCNIWYGPNDKGLMGINRCSCKKSYCESCQVLIHQPKRREELTYILEKLLKREGGNTIKKVGGTDLSRVFFVTHTWKHKKGRSYEKEANHGRACWKKFVNSRFYKRNVVGVWRVEEVTARFTEGNMGEKVKTFNPHYHSIIYVKDRQSAELMESKLESLWIGQGAGWVDCKVAKIGNKNKIKMELTSYLVKSWDTEGILLAEIIAGLRGRRLFNKAGIFKKWAKEAKVAKEDTEIKKEFVEQHPSPINQITGEVATFNSVTIGFRKVYDLATHGDWSSIWLIKFSKWLQKATNNGPEGHFDWEAIEEECGINRLFMAADKRKPDSIDLAYGSLVEAA